MKTTPPQAEGPASPRPEEGRQTQQAGPTPGPAATRLVEGARSDLALKLGIPADQITVSSVQMVTWPDSSLGCPQPGMAYAQVLTRGYLILLEAGGETYEYHSSGRGEVFYCKDPQAPVPGTPPDV